ncbi:MAG: hypothetical protein AAGO57_09070 [Pseudomonadota bacterium]
MKTLLVSACLTGLFCAGFATVVDLLADMLNRSSVMIISFISGFLGSIFAQTVLQSFRNKDQ